MEEILPSNENVTMPVNPVFFNDEIMPIFDQYCNPHCHSKDHPSVKFHPFLNPSLAYNELMSGGYVDTTNPEHSILYLRVEGQSLGNIMPPGRKLSDYQIKRILDWIKYGAPNN